MRVGAGNGCLSQRGASWGRENTCWTVVGWSKRLRGQSNGKRLVRRCACVRRVWPMRSRERTTSVRRVVCWEDDHGREKLLSWAGLLLAEIWSYQRAVQFCLIRLHMVRVMSFGKG